jgi:hypothetical protein
LTSPVPILAGGAALQAHFHGAVHAALRNQRIGATERSCEYLASLLHGFAQSAALPLAEPEVRFLHRPLADLWAEAEAAHGPLRAQRLRGLGDLSLYVSGYFGEVLTRRLVDVDYYVAMGRRAYDRLARAVDGPAPGSPFHELAARFSRFVDVLSEVSATDPARPGRSVLRLYERWMRTRSPWAADELQRLGLRAAASEDGELQ